MYINSDLPGLPPNHQTTGKPLRCAPPPPPLLWQPLILSLPGGLCSGSRGSRAASAETLAASASTSAAALSSPRTRTSPSTRSASRSGPASRRCPQLSVGSEAHRRVCPTRFCFFPAGLRPGPCRDCSDIPRAGHQPQHRTPPKGRPAPPFSLAIRIGRWGPPDGCLPSILILPSLPASKKMGGRTSELFSDAGEEADGQLPIPFLSASSTASQHTRGPGL